MKPVRPLPVPSAPLRTLPLLPPFCALFSEAFLLAAASARTDFGFVVEDLVEDFLGEFDRGIGGELRHSKMGKKG
jgi:hypothetical protein